MSMPFIEAAAKAGLNPLEELMYVLKQTRKVKFTVKDEDGSERVVEEVVPLLVAHMGGKDGMKQYMQALMFLTEFSHPKLRTVEHTGGEDHTLTIEIRQYAGPNTIGGTQIIEVAGSDQLPAADRQRIKLVGSGDHPSGGVGLSDAGKEAGGDSGEDQS